MNAIVIESPFYARGVKEIRFNGKRIPADNVFRVELNVSEGGIVTLGLHSYPGGEPTLWELP